MADNASEAKVSNETKISSFKAKQSMPYDFKVKYAHVRAWEFYNECGKRGLDCYVSVGGLDSITLFYFLKLSGFMCLPSPFQALKISAFRRYIVSSA